jgi:hypothetical protein
MDRFEHLRDSVSLGGLRRFLFDLPMYRAMQYCRWSSGSIRERDTSWLRVNVGLHRK